MGEGPAGHDSGLRWRESMYIHTYVVQSTSGPRLPEWVLSPVTVPVP